MSSQAARVLEPHLQLAVSVSLFIWSILEPYRRDHFPHFGTRILGSCSSNAKYRSRTNRKDDALFPRPSSLDLAAGTVTIGMQADEAYGSGRMRERRDDREQDVETTGLQRVLPFFLAPVRGCHDPG